MSILTDRLASGVLPAGQLSKLLGVSRATLMRRVRADSEKVVRLGKGRATRYGLRREILGLGSSVPAFRIDRSGRPHRLGDLAILAASQTAWASSAEVFDGIPPEVADMRPAGFMGRAFPRRNPDLPLPARITDWSDDHILVALARRGEDLAGNLVLGDESMERWFSQAPVAVTREHYPEFAVEASRGDPPGSSAGGERPKFGAFSNGRHVLVKFVALGGGPVAERWRDLLILESIALHTLREGGESAAEACIVESSSHTFLEVVRFDRIGERGRRATLSLAAMDCDLSDPWARIASRLNAIGLLGDDDTQQLKLYDAFGQLIANTDRHAHNVLLFPVLAEADEAVVSRRFLLAPAFDQLPMLYAPTADGQLPERELETPTPRSDTWDVWERAVTLARAFWRRASADHRVSTDMQRIAARHKESLET